MTSRRRRAGGCNDEGPAGPKINIVCFTRSSIKAPEGRGGGGERELPTASTDVTTVAWPAARVPITIVENNT